MSVPVPVACAKRRKPNQQSPSAVPASIAKSASSATSSLHTSTSNLSKAQSLKDIVLFEYSTASEFRGQDKQCYDLRNIADRLSVDHVNVKCKSRNDQIASKCILSLLKEMNLDPIPILRTDCQVSHMHELSPLYTSTNERPDVVIYSCDETTVITIIEVNSSPMVETERKATLVAKDLLRLLRCADSSISSVSVFCFPKCEVKQCIIEIKVEWKYFRIFTKLTRFPKLKEGLDRLKAVIVAQKGHPKINKPSNKALMKLSDDDLKIFGTGFMQLDSPSHIIVTDKKTVVKLLYDTYICMEHSS